MSVLCNNALQPLFSVATHNVTGLKVGLTHATFILVDAAIRMTVCGVVRSRFATVFFPCGALGLICDHCIDAIIDPQSLLVFLSQHELQLLQPRLLLLLARRQGLGGVAG